MAETYYDRLGVPPDATADEIEQAYRSQLKETHPDVSDDPAANERTRDLIEARDVLTDEAERARYDRLGHDRYVRFHDSFVEPDDEDIGDRTPDASTGTGVGETAGNGAAGESDWSTGRRTDTGTASTDREQRRAQNEQTRATWNTAGQGSATHATGDHQAREWHAWDTGATHRVYPTDRSTLGNRLFPPGPSVLLLVTAFAIYPVMLWAALTPAFPLAVNAVVGLCIVFVVAFLQSMPSVGMLVFGTWSVLLPAVLTLAAGVPVLSAVWLLALGGTALPLGLSVLTWFALRH